MRAIPMEGRAASGWRALIAATAIGVLPIVSRGGSVSAFADETAPAAVGDPAGSVSFEAGLAAYRAGDFARARRIWLPLAEWGNPVAQNNLGCIAEEDGPLHDLAAAVGWYAGAAAAGYVIAQFNLAVMYEKGRGVARDYALARRWYTAAAAQGDAQALNNLALQQYRGQGGPKDPATAAKTFAKAAKAGSVKAAYNLGKIFEQGDGGAPNPAMAAQWYRRAAAQNYAPALDSLGLLYAKGSGVQQDFAAALDAFRRAAEQGDAAGQYLLAIGYRHGTGVPRDDVAALKWFTLAAAQGHASAVKERDALLATMPQPQIDKALEQAPHWQPRGPTSN